MDEVRFQRFEAPKFYCIGPSGQPWSLYAGDYMHESLSKITPGSKLFIQKEKPEGKSYWKLVKWQYTPVQDAGTAAVDVTRKMASQRVDPDPLVDAVNEVCNHLNEINTTLKSMKTTDPPWES